MFTDDIKKQLEKGERARLSALQFEKGIAEKKSIQSIAVPDVPKIKSPSILDQENFVGGRVDGAIMDNIIANSPKQTYPSVISPSYFNTPKSDTVLETSKSDKILGVKKETPMWKPSIAEQNLNVPMEEDYGTQIQKMADNVAQGKTERKNKLTALQTELQGIRTQFEQAKSSGKINEANNLIKIYNQKLPVYQQAVEDFNNYGEEDIVKIDDYNKRIEGTNKLLQGLKALKQTPQAILKQTAAEISLHNMPEYKAQEDVKGLLKIVGLGEPEELEKAKKKYEEISNDPYATEKEISDVANNLKTLEDKEKNLRGP